MSGTRPPKDEKDEDVSRLNFTGSWGVEPSVGLSESKNSVLESSPNQEFDINKLYALIEKDIQFNIHKEKVTTFCFFRVYTKEANFMMQLNKDVEATKYSRTPEESLAKLEALFQHAKKQVSAKDSSFDIKGTLRECLTLCEETLARARENLELKEAPRL